MPNWNFSVSGIEYIAEIALNTNTRFIVWETWMTGRADNNRYKIAFPVYYYSDNNPAVFIQRKDGGTWSGWYKLQMQAV